MEIPDPNPLATLARDAGDALPAVRALLEGVVPGEDARQRGRRVLVLLIGYVTVGAVLLIGALDAMLGKTRREEGAWRIILACVGLAHATLARMEQHTTRNTCEPRPDPAPASPRDATPPRDP